MNASAGSIGITDYSTRMIGTPALPKADCQQCDAVCCRLVVMVEPEDRIAAHLTTLIAGDLLVMAKEEDGWCVALDGERMCCSIYAARPDTCRRFHMGGPYCEAVREDYARAGVRGIPLQLLGDHR